MTFEIRASLLLITWLMGCAVAIPNPVNACDSSADEAPRPHTKRKP